MIKKDTKVAVLGAGAMGCLFGGLLAEKGLDVVLIDVWKVWLCCRYRQRNNKVFFIRNSFYNSRASMPSL